MKTRIELSKAYKKGIEIERERILKLIDEMNDSDIRFVDKTCKNILVRELKARIEG